MHGDFLFFTSAIVYLAYDFNSYSTLTLVLLMMLMKKIANKLPGIMAGALLFLTLTPCHAQVRGEQEPPKNRQCEESGRDETRWMTKNLYLSTEQYDKVKDLNIYYSCLMDNLSHMPDKSVATKKKGEIIRSKEAEFKAVLSHEQFEQYKNRTEKKVMVKKSAFSESI